MDGQMRITVLGSSGQIGAYLSEYLSRKGHIVREFDIVNGIHQDMTHIPNTYLRNAIMESDFVFFLAFDVGGSRYLKKYQHTFDFVNNNTRLMANAFGLLQEYDKPFVFASSQMSNMSYSPYGTLKRVGELYTESLGGLIVKFWNVYGIEKDHNKAHVITDFIRKGFEDGDRHPKVEEGVSIFASSTILGNITLGKNSIVAAGSLVLDDVDANTTVAGIPAKKLN